MKANSHKLKRQGVSYSLQKICYDNPRDPRCVWGVGHKVYEGGAGGSGAGRDGKRGSTEGPKPTITPKKDEPTIIPPPPPPSSKKKEDIKDDPKDDIKDDIKDEPKWGEEETGGGLEGKALDSRPLGIVDEANGRIVRPPTEPPFSSGMSRTFTSEGARADLLRVTPPIRGPSGTYIEPQVTPAIPSGVEPSAGEPFWSPTPPAWGRAGAEVRGAMPRMDLSGREIVPSSLNRATGADIQVSSGRVIGQEVGEIRGGLPTMRGSTNWWGRGIGSGNGVPVGGRNMLGNNMTSRTAARSAPDVPATEMSAAGERVLDADVVGNTGRAVTGAPYDIPDSQIMVRTLGGNQFSLAELKGMKYVPRPKINPADAKMWDARGMPRMGDTASRGMTRGAVADEPSAFSLDAPALGEQTVARGGYATDISAAGQTTEAEAAGEAAASGAADAAAEAAAADAALVGDAELLGEVALL